MLSPETSVFSAPRITRSEQWESEESDIFASIRAYPFYHTISVVCPDEYKFPDSISDLVHVENYFYKLSDCPVKELISKTFVKSFVIKGAVSCLSVNSYSEVDNCIAVTEDGCLLLHIINKLYEQLGLDGKRSSENFFEICLNLNSSKLNSVKYWNIIVNALEKLGRFDFIIKWKPHEDHICPSSIAKYFYERKVKVCIGKSEIDIVQRDVNRVPQPRLGNLSELVEWVGAVANSTDLESSELYVSTYQQPVQEDDLAASSAAVLITKGFFTPDDVINIYGEIMKYNCSREDTYWTALNCQVFSDTPTKSRGKLHFEAADIVCTMFIQNKRCSIFKTHLMK